MVLRAQLSDWERFRKFQRKVRRYYQHRSFSDLDEKVRERRRRHQLEGDVCQRFDPGQQSGLENWVEFRDYHLHYHERLEKKRDGLKEELDVAGKGVEGTENDEDDRTAIQEILKATKRQLERHKNLLQWIEQERLVMVSMHRPSD